MSENPVAKGGPGRQKGATNLMGRTAKEAILHVFEEVGGVEGLKQWVLADEAHLKIFYMRIFPKLLPYQQRERQGSIVEALVVHFK